jgi:Binding-protein-dependent transport system inner membrane component
MVVFLAGLQDIPRDFYEAASIDGANAWQRFWRITLPLLQPSSTFVLVTAFISSFQVFDPVYVLTGGGPANATSATVSELTRDRSRTSAVAAGPSAPGHHSASKRAPLAPPIPYRSGGRSGTRGRPAAARRQPPA